MFLNDLPGISPNREIDFGINLLLNTYPISIPLYRMALTEMRKLKKQLKNLLDMFFICSSVSLWSAPMLLCVRRMVFFGCV